MRKTIQIIRNWIFIPSLCEISILFFFLGFYIVVATEVLIASIWFNTVFYSLLIIEGFYVFRGISFVFALKTKKIMSYKSRWLQLLFIGITLMIIFMTNIDVSLKLRFSERAMLDQVRYIQSLPSEVQDRRFNMNASPVGFFNVRLERVDNSRGTVWFHTIDGHALLGPMGLYGGIAYSENGFPPEVHERACQHLYGPWWLWVQDM
ncbi:MAG: hypothetical protein ABFR90_06200 [Planctomycetota bacterium]